MKVIIPSLLLCVLSAISIGGQGNTHSQQLSQVHGIVSDPNGWRVGGANLQFESPRAVKSVRTNAEGEYQIDLPPDVYRLSVTTSGYFQMRRADLRLVPSDSVEINITIFLNTPVRVIRKGKVVGLRPPFNMDTFAIPESDRRLRLVILYGQSSKGRLGKRYKGVTLADGVTVPVIISYNHLTIRAEEVSLNINRLTLKAEGNVLIEDGQQPTRCKSAELIFKHGMPVIATVTSD